MKNFLKIFSGFGGRKNPVPVKPVINLAAFGKHPAWDDHIPGIGLETEALAHLKQAFYVSGIGGQIDAGAWEKLEAEKRVEGFDHAFLWIRNGHALLGRLWSSVDRKGRAKYPMVVCADSQGISPGLLLANTWRELEQLRDSCRTFTTTEQVESECRSSQARLRSRLEAITETDKTMGIPLESRRRFLDHPQFGDRQEGLLRILHELAGLQSPPAKGRSQPAGQSGEGRSRHLRLPAIGHKHDEVLQLWGDFFRAAIAGNLPVFLILRDGVEWLDVIVGEPAGDEFFCLQASPLASPLATQIPYDLKPELNAQLQKLTASFLDPSGTSPGTAYKPEVGGGPPDLGNGSSPASLTPPGGKLPLVLLGLALTLGLGVSWFFFHSHRPEPVAAAVPQPGVKPLASTNQSETQPKYAAAMAAGLAALKSENHDLALTQAKAALLLKPNDPAAQDLQNQAQAKLDERAAVQALQQKFDAAVKAGQDALGRKEYAAAVAQAKASLLLKPGDATAQDLQKQAQAKLDELAATQALQQKFEASVKAGQAAFGRQDFTTALAQAKAALLLKPGNATALDLQKQAQAKLAGLAAVEQQQAQFKALLATGQSAYDQKDFPTAVRKATEALELQPENAEAQTLQTSARKQADYQAAVTAGQAAVKRTDYSAASQQAQTALAINPAGAAALQLQADAAAGTDLQQVKTLMSKPDATAALDLCARHPNEPAFVALASQIRQAELQTLDDKLETYQVWFGLIKPNAAKSDLAKKPEQKKNAQDLANGSFTAPIIAYYTDLINKLESQLTALHQLDAGRALILKNLRRSIEQHP